MNDKTVINRLPISVTAQSGMLSKKPQLSIAVTISSGRVVSLVAPKPALFIMVDMIPCTILNIASISSIPYVTKAFAMAKRTNSFKACSGFLTSTNDEQVLTTPITKKVQAMPNRLPVLRH